jgi:hypothetical protein
VPIRMLNDLNQLAANKELLSRDGTRAVCRWFQFGTRGERVAGNAIDSVGVAWLSALASRLHGSRL